MAGNARSRTAWPPKLLLGDKGSPNQSELKVISNAIHAALEYSPMSVAPEHHQDVYAQVSRRVADRFWTDIYVDRPEIRDIIHTLETGLLTLITGERGSGKSTAIRAVIRELTGSTDVEVGIDLNRTSPNLIPYIFDANRFTEGMTDEQMVADRIHEHMFSHLDERIRDRSAWFGFLFEKSQAFYEFKLALGRAKLNPRKPTEWRYLGEADRYAGSIDSGMSKFAASPISERLQLLLEFIGQRTTYEPLLIIDNVDHLDPGLVLKCGLVLGSIAQSSDYRVRAAMALRPDTAEALRWRFDTLPQFPQISMKRPVYTEEDQAVWVTLRVLERRLRVLREPDVVEAMRAAIDKKRAAQLAADFDERSVSVFFDKVLELLNVMIFEAFDAGEGNAELRAENLEFARAVHDWHNGSLREGGLSLTKFASEILGDDQRMTHLRSLLATMGDGSEAELRLRRPRLRRISRNLLFRHLLLWAAPEADQPRPLRNVMVFDGSEEATTPPIHFLPLRILQYLAKRRPSRASVTTIRADLGQLGLVPRRVDEALRDLSVKRTQDDAGLIRIDGRWHAEAMDGLPDQAVIHLLDAGKFLAGRLYVTTEYLFWSALYTKAATEIAEIPAKVTSAEMQNDAFRATVAARFVERYLVEKFIDEHPYLRGDEQWTPQRARTRLKLYEDLFGFSPKNWFLSHAAASLSAFIPARDPDGEWREARISIERVRALAESLDELREATGPLGVSTEEPADGE
jgi:energy-coupling factor transporter ATP-binding protein EcfA2